MFENIMVSITPKKMYTNGFIRTSKGLLQFFVVSVSSFVNEVNIPTRQPLRTDDKRRNNLTCVRVEKHIPSDCSP